MSEIKWNDLSKKLTGIGIYFGIINTWEGFEEDNPYFYKVI